MIIDLSSILDKTEELLQFEGSLSIGNVDLGRRDINIVEPVFYKGNIYRVDGQLAIDMELNYDYSEECHRCLRPTTNSVNFLLSGKLIKGQEDYDDEDEGFDEVFYYEDEFLKIEDYILNQVILSLPMKSLCNPDCKGLCSTCGADLNNIKCTCIQESIDPRFEKLKNFFPKN